MFQLGNLKEKSFLIDRISYIIYKEVFTEMNKEELIQKIKDAATAYYTGQEILQDSEYDLLIEELRAILSGAL